VNEAKQYLIDELHFEELIGDSQWVYLNEEATGGDLQDIAWSDREFLDLSPRASEIDWVRYIKMDDKRTFRFNVEAVTTDTAHHTMRLKALEMPELIEDRDDEDIDGIKEDLQTSIAAGNVALHCTDASFQYWGFGFLLNNTDAAWSSGPKPDYMDIRPDERNPEQKRFLCKHLYRLLDDIINEDKHLDEMSEDVSRKIRSGKL
jgi:hypothetical protein